MEQAPIHIRNQNTEKYNVLREFIEDKPLLKEYFNYQATTGNDYRINMLSLEHYLRIQVHFFEYAAVKLDHDFLSHSPDKAQLDLIGFGFVDEFIRELPKILNSRVKEYAPKTSNNYRISINSFFEWAYDFDYVRRNEIKKSIRKQSKSKQHGFKATTLNNIETKALLELVYAGKTSIEDRKIELTKKEMEYHKNNYLRNTTIITLMLFLGLRLSEVSNLNIGDVDFNNNEITFFRKGGSYHTLTLSELVRERLNSLIEMKSEEEMDCPALFTSRYRGQYNRLSTIQISKLVTKYLKMIRTNKNDKHELNERIKLTPHKLRSTLATYLLNKGYDMAFVAWILNHQSTETTKIYFDIDERTAKDMLDHVKF